LVEKPFDSKLSGEWFGSNENKHGFLNTYIQEKFKTKLYILPFIRFGIFYDEEIKQTLFKIEDWSTMKQYFKGQDSFEPFIKKYRDTTKRFTFFPITTLELATDESDLIGHSVSALYDKKFNKVEIFDSINTDFKHFKETFKELFSEIYGKNVKIVYIANRCVAFGKLASECDETLYKYKSEGFCVIWVLWFLELRLANPEIPKEKLIKKALKRLKDGDKVCKFVRGYAQFVDNIVSKYSIVRTSKNLVIEPKDPKSQVFAKKDYRFLYVLLASLVGGFAAFRILDKIKKID
jgi:hypothetical protein